MVGSHTLARVSLQIMEWVYLNQVPWLLISLLSWGTGTSYTQYSKICLQSLLNATCLHDVGALWFELKKILGTTIWENKNGPPCSYSLLLCDLELCCLNWNTSVAIGILFKQTCVNAILNMVPVYLSLKRALCYMSKFVSVTRQLAFCETRSKLEGVRRSGVAADSYH